MVVFVRKPVSNFISNSILTQPIIFWWWRSSRNYDWLELTSTFAVYQLNCNALFFFPSSSNLTSSRICFAPRVVYSYTNIKWDMICIANVIIFNRWYNNILFLLFSLNVCHTCYYMCRFGLPALRKFT